MPGEFRGLEFEFLRICPAQFFEVEDFPLQGGQFAKVRKWHEAPIRFESHEAEEKLFVPFLQVIAECGAKVRASLLQFGEQDGFCCHAHKLLLVDGREIFVFGKDQSVCRVVVAGKVADKAIDNLRIEMVPEKHFAHIEEIPRVLAVEGCDELASVEFLPGVR